MAARSEPDERPEDQRGAAPRVVFSRLLRAIQAEKDAAGDIAWLVSVDSTIVRAHQHATGGKKGHAIGTKRVITPSADPVAD